MCYQKGHYQSDCSILKQFRLDNTRRKDHGTSALKAEEAGNVVIAEEFDSDSICTGPERTILATQSPAWVVDLGATKYFTGD